MESSSSTDEEHDVVPPPPEAPSASPTSVLPPPPSPETPESPPELKDMLLQFTTKVLTDKPPDLVAYAAHYFKKLLNDKNASDAIRKHNEISQTGEPSDTVPEEAVIPCFMPKPKVRKDTPRPKQTPTSRRPVRKEIGSMLGSRRGRRSSVCAEKYDPEVDEEVAIQAYEKSSQQRAKIKDSIEGMFLFRALDESEIDSVIEAMMPREVKAGETIIHQGEQGDYFYVVESGTYRVYITKPNGELQEVSSYDNTGSFGELALMYNEPRAATVKADTNGHLWALSRHTFRHMVLKRAYEKRKRYERLLKRVPELKPLTMYQRATVCDALLPRSYEAGQLIFRQGDQGDGMYFVERGEVAISISTDDDSDDVEISRIRPGGYFGELALLTRARRAASAQAVGKVKLAFLDVHAFERLLGSCVQLLNQHIQSYQY